jgi:hypothetical protein
LRRSSSEMISMTRTYYSNDKGFIQCHLKVYASVLWIKKILLEHQRLRSGSCSIWTGSVCSHCSIKSWKQSFNIKKKTLSDLIDLIIRRYSLSNWILSPLWNGWRAGRSQKKSPSLLCRSEDRHAARM